MKEKDDSKEVASTAFQTVAQVIIAGAAATIIDPVVGAGAGALASQFFGLRGQLKMARANSFVIELGKYMQSVKGDFEWENANREDFGDILEEVINKVIRTSSEKKRERFKLTVAGQIINPLPYDYISRFINLIEMLSEEQIIILKTYVSTEEEFINIQAETAKIYETKESSLKAQNNLVLNKANEKLTKQTKMRLQSLEGEILEKQNAYNRIRRKRNERIKNIGENEFNFMLNDLRVLGLVYNPSEGRASDTGEYSGFRCTRLAMEFMEFLQ